MRHDPSPKNRNHKPPPASAEALRARFANHFPRLFAYAHAFVGDGASAKTIVIETFSRAFARYPDLPDDKFRLVLFGLASGLCPSTPPAAGRHDGLTNREREVLALMFDAQFKPGEIGSLLKIKEEAVNAALLRGLRKLRTSMSATTAIGYPSLA